LPYSSTFDISGDWEVFGEGIFTVNYYVRTDEDQFDDAVEVENALRESQVRAIPNHRAVQTTVWHLWTAKIGAIVPKAGDVIEHSSTRWVVINVEIETLATRYECACVKER